MSDKYSYSKLDTYKQCPFRFYLNYVLGNYAYSDSIATEYGSAIHKCEEEIANAIIAKQPIDYIGIKNNFILKTIALQKKYPIEYFENDGKSDRNYVIKTIDYLDHGIYNLEKFMNEHPTYEIVGVEQKFTFELQNNYTFTGAIDRVFHDTATDAYLIQDIKSWAVPAKDDDLITPLQFVIYVMAVKDLFGVTADKISCEYYLPLVDCGLTQHAGTSGFVTRGLKKITDLLNNIDSKDFTPHKSPLCNWCPYSKTNPDAAQKFKFLCPYHSNWDRQTRNKADISKSDVEWCGLEQHAALFEEYCLKNNIIIEK